MHIKNTGELYHYGVKGMKWGVTRTPAQLGHEPKHGKRPKAENRLSKKISAYITRKNEGKPKKKTVSEMTDEELEARVRRLTNELKVKDLEKQNMDTGRKIVNEVLKDTGEKALRKFGDRVISDIFDKKKKDKRSIEDLEKNPRKLNMDDLSMLESMHKKMAYIEDRNRPTDSRSVSQLEKQKMSDLSPKDLSKLKQMYEQMSFIEEKKKKMNK